jgi:rod shape-determining protein MreC
MMQRTMQKHVSLPCFLLALFLLGWSSLSRSASDQARVFAVCALSPGWRLAAQVKEYISDRPFAKAKKNEPVESSLLQVENQRLMAELEWAKEWIFNEARLEKEAKAAYLSGLRDLRSKAIPAPVIYRDPSSWSSSLWIGVGEEDNQKIGCKIVARNSPVVEGSSLVGVVEYVGKQQSRVRLITDSGLTPAVRVVRDGQPKEIFSLIDALTEKLNAREGFFEIVNQLQGLKERLLTKQGEVYLAKGELRGNGAPFWRSRQPILKGVGFNYDYADAEGPARELRTGQTLSGLDKPIPLIAEGDRLVTSGLDGVFPKGISVAIVTSVFPLNVGSFSYEIEAQPTACRLNDLKVVFVLPTLSGE